MKNHLIIKNILFLPVRFYSENSSIYSLLKGSGYFEIYDNIKENDLLEALIEYPECVENWLLLSENKRTTSGWFFEQNNVGKYIIGFSHANGDIKHKEYDDIKEACAAFIKREIEDIRKS